MIQRILGELFILFSASMLIPIGVSLWYDDGEVVHFLLSTVTVFAYGLLLWAPVRNWHAELRRRDGFLIVALFWIVLGPLGALPFMFGPHLSFVDSVFEAVSGFTTTGATIMHDLERLPPSVLFYRQQLQWLGGMGLVVLAVALGPTLGIGGMQLYTAEAPGPMKEERLTPRLAYTARTLWLIYLGLTLACAFLYWVAGMTPFDAIAHSLSTISTGGYSTHDASFGFFSSPGIEAVAIAFMFLSAVNFSVHFLVWHKTGPVQYLRDEETRVFLFTVLGASLLFSLVLAGAGADLGIGNAVRHAVFQVVSVITSTGFTTVDFALWPLPLPLLLIFLSFVGGCGGSTAGGMKVVRVLLLAKQGLREIALLVHPSAVRHIKLGQQVLSERIIASVWGFFAVYAAAFVVLVLLMQFTGLDIVSATSAIATCMNNLGPGLGVVSTNFAEVSDVGKMVSVVAMLLGRLEVFTILVLLSPAYWRS